jgi:RNA polymerase sigma-70 factor, ECF subfamily
MNEYGASLARFAAGFESDPTTREDLVQDICLAIWRALPRFRGDCSERTFLFRIAQNRGLTHRLRHGRTSWETTDPDDLSDPRSNPEQEAMEKDQRDRLATAIRLLPDLHRTAVLLFLEGFSHREIAAVVGTSDGNVAVRLTRARQRLRELLDQGGAGP